MDGAGVAIPEAAQRLGISEGALRQRIKRRKITTVHTAGRVLGPLSELPAPGADGAVGTAVGTVAPGVGTVGTAYEALVVTLREQLAVKDAQLAERAREVQELHVLLQRSQHQLTGAPAATAPSPAGPARCAPWWRRLWGQANYPA